MSNNYELTNLAIPTITEIKFCINGIINDSTQMIKMGICVESKKCYDKVASVGVVLMLCDRCGFIII